MTGEVAANLARVKENIARAAENAGRDPKSVRLVAVSKKQPADRVRAAYDAGHRDFGENYVQEMLRRMDELPGDVVWHMIGHVQTNKAKGAARAAMIHSIDSEKLAKAIAAKASTPIDVLIEVNAGNEDTKSGIEEGSVEELADVVLRQPGLRLRGFMCIPPPDSGGVWFARLRSLRDAIARRLEVELPELSMGMSGDYELAIREGSTIVRVGTAIFGSR